MFRSYIKIAFRNLARNKVFSFINIFGLATGLATCLLIMLYIFDENSYDQYHKDGDRVFRVASAPGDKIGAWAACPAPVAEGMKNDLPEVEQVARLLSFPDIKKMLFRYDAGSERKQFFETNGYYADSSFFQLFSYDFIYGNGLRALDQPNTVVISSELSRKFFGVQDPVGKSLTVTTPFGDFPYKVTAVFDGSRVKSHIPSNFFLSMQNKDMGTWAQAQTNWATNNIFYTYIKLKKGVQPAVFEKKMASFFERRAGPDMKAGGFSKSWFLQPLKDIYLHSSIDNEIAANGNIKYLYILGSIAAFILLIACINFMNLSTARSEKRAKEVGVRKVLGAERGSLVRQFLGESFIMCLMALALALVMARILLPLFNSITQKNLHAFGDLKLVGWITALTLLTGLMAGLYPAFYLSAFRPVSVLKGKIANSFSAAVVRKGLVVFQFTVSICLVLGAVIILKQLAFLKQQDLGFAKDQQLILPMQYANTAQNYTVLKNELLKDPRVRSVTAGSSYPGIENINDMLFYPEGKTIKDIVDIGLSAVENDYTGTLGFTILHGRGFSKEFTADSAGIILNEAAVKALGYPEENAVGRKINYDFQGVHSTMQIVGIVKDFNFESLHSIIKPFGLTTGLFSNKYSYVIASFRTPDYQSLITGVEKIWRSVIPGQPFSYSFLDQDFQRNYEKEQRTSQIVGYFTSIAILIACLGLFGLSSFSAEQRTKEIGVRKVLGASVRDIAALLSRDFIRLVVIAILIASPLAWYVMNKWLQDFAYRTPLSWYLFVLAGLWAILIALVTVSFQAIKAALANPVKSLHTE